MRGSGGIWRALSQARRDNLADSGEAVPTRESPATTRRALLAAIAATGAVGAMAALPRASRAFAGGRVAIIGGGMAGLSALHRLTAAGIDAHLYEAGGRLGGRMFTRRPRDGGPAFEEGAQLVNTDHEDMHALLREFGIALIDRKPAAHETLVMAGGKPVPQDRLAEALRPIAAQIGADADRLDKDYGAVAPALDRLSIAQYLDLHRALVPHPWVRRLLEATSRTEYGVEPDAASALGLIFNLPTVDGRRVEILGGADERYVVEGGSSALIDAMATRHAARIETGRRLVRIARKGTALQLHFADGSRESAESAIVALPAGIAGRIDYAAPIPPEWHGFHKAIALGCNEKVQVATSAAPGAQLCGSGGEVWQTDAGAGWSQGWDGSVHRKQGVSPVWTWYLGGGEALSRSKAPRDQANSFADAVAAQLPELAPHNRLVRRTAWHRNPLIGGGYVNYAPGVLTRYGKLLWIEGSEHLHFDSGRIQFAGEHLSDAFPGYMNGAAQTGRMAAEALIDGGMRGATA
ncbi:flavin monoamine oxidase family protein [Sphingosinithalassobacter portus]|uniref:flavin monoamine oxidase family protein n=1 Tax=Stakelama portus TaxID=2676234 RepID=UPI001EFC51EF|nr:NAD(P)/FAD-dependent oxidoreductase [Sphingosinithalassobacter portus]